MTTWSPRTPIAGMLIVTGPETGGRRVGVGVGVGVGEGVTEGVADVEGAGAGAGTSARGALPLTSEHPANTTSTITTTPASLTRRK
ncbi:hypothetical protein OG474_23420 [Kribbella sp. NBC_01505]|uniref:hypothetical protein n=1 Tax=Kribbella sp. NBC_01505 TaxID=2903580 RepID=UPI0038701133